MRRQMTWLGGDSIVAELNVAAPSFPGHLKRRGGGNALTP